MTTEHGFTYEWASQTPRNLLLTYSTDASVPNTLFNKTATSYAMTFKPSMEDNKKKI